MKTKLVIFVFLITCFGFSIPTISINAAETDAMDAQVISSKSPSAVTLSKIENLSRNITEIINLGIELTSSPPSYFYSKLADVKHQMIADATKDAKQRAEKIAENAGSSLGKLKKATMGITQITAPNST